MSGNEWSELSRVPPEGLREATLELHWALQYVAAAGQTFVEPRPDDSHRACRWDPDLRAFVGEPFAGPYPFRVALRPEDLTLLLVDRTGSDLGALPLPGVPREEGFDWLGIGMATYLGGAPPLLARPEYDIPHHPVADREPFSTGLEAELHTLAALFGGAAEILTNVATTRTGASEVRCWPHHFDIATLLSAEGSERTVGVGFAPMGSGYDEWYWYVSPWHASDSSTLRPLVSGGRWHTSGWTGAVLPADEVVSVPPMERAAKVRAFLDGAIDAALRVPADEGPIA